MNHYVLRIYQREDGQLAGTVEWVESGWQEVFHDAEELLAILAIASRHRKKPARGAYRQAPRKAREGRSEARKRAAIRSFGPGYSTAGGAGCGRIDLPLALARRRR